MDGQIIVQEVRSKELLYATTMGKILWGSYMMRRPQNLLSSATASNLPRFFVFIVVIIIIIILMYMKLI